jgi:nucleotide-binding universal stress UspA family protein
MEKQPQPKLLLPVDGSDRSMNTIRYISKIDPFRRMRVILFHVFSKIPDGFWDLETEPRSTSTVKKVRAWEIQQKIKIKQYMARARQFLLKAGFPSEQNGYGAIVMGRIGQSRVRDFFIGRVTNKVIHMARDRTVWVIR